jgi:SAM-dependent methyltransferase
MVSFVIDRRIAMAAVALLSAGVGWGARELTRPELGRAPPPASSTTGQVPSAAEARTNPPPATSQDMQKAFEDVYRNATWGKNAEDAGYSGTGSTMRTTLLYRTFLAQFMKDADIHSVVDAGCGDWEFSQSIDWTGIDYKGFDIVPSVVEQDKKKFTKDNVHFFVGNIVDDDLPPADLLISKHVLQHLPTAAVEKFLTQLPKYKHVLLMNGVSAATLSSKNTDIAPGEYRPLDLTRPPFNLPGAKLLTYWDGVHMQQVVYISREREPTPIPAK